MFHMRLHRFYINEKVGDKNEIVISDFDLIHQLINVFRFGVGDKVILFDGSGFEFECEISTISKKEIKLNLLIKTQGKEVLNKNITLYLSLIKKSNFELAVEKCTEIGVTEIQPIISERSEKKDLNIERLNKIAKEASEQSGRVTLPKIFNILSLEEAVSQAVKEGRVCVVFDPSGEKHKTVSRKDIAIFVGPEGGWTEKELALFKQNEFQIISIGENILRAETAAMAASSLFLIL